MRLERQRLKVPPESWDRRPIKFHLAAFFGGGTPRKDNEDFWCGGTIPWVSPKDMKCRRIEDAEDWITSDAVAQSATSIVPENSVLMVVRSGILKRTLPVAFNTIPVTLNQDMKAFRFRSGLMPEFFLYWIEGQSAQLLLEWRQVGATVDNIDIYAMLNARIAVPSLETQESIAGFLDRETARIDQLIEKKERLVEIAGWKLSATIHDCVNSVLSVSEQPIHRFCRTVTGKTPSRAVEENFSTDHGLPWATPANLGFFEPILTTRERLTQDGAKGQVVVPSGTVLINGIGASIGKIGFAGCEMSFNQQIHGIVQFQKLLNDRFLFFVMYTKKDEIVSLASNTTIPIINAERFGRISVPLPTDNFQIDAVRTIDASVSHSRNITKAVSLSIDRLREFRSALITAAVTGQIDVNTWSRRGSTDRRLDQIEEAMRA